MVLGLCTQALLNILEGWSVRKAIKLEVQDGAAENCCIKKAESRFAHCAGVQEPGEDSTTH